MVFYGSGATYVNGIYQSPFFQSNGYAAHITYVSSTYTATSSDEVILVTTGASTITVNLPATTSINGRKLLIIKIDSGAGSVTVAVNGSDTIEGNTSVSLASQYNKLGIVADSTNTIWYDLGKGGQ